MTPENDAKLCAKYPKLYAQRNLPMQETCMCWGFPGDGWYDLIDRLSAKLEPLGVEAVQVKEKFGTLRFYTNKYVEAAEEAIRDAEAESAKTCEICGSKKASVCGGFWLKTLCDKCDEERNTKHDEFTKKHRS